MVKKKVYRHGFLESPFIGKQFIIDRNSRGSDLGSGYIIITPVSIDGDRLRYHMVSTVNHYNETFGGTSIDHAHTLIETKYWQKL
jgi:hypothetical protein